SYDPTTGRLFGWVVIPTLSHTSDVVIYMYYGDASVTTFQGDVPGTWTGFEAVWHLQANGSVTSGLDSTAQAHDGTVSNVTPTTGPGGMDAGAFNGTNSKIVVPGSTALTPSPYHISIWFQYPSFQGSFGVMWGIYDNTVLGSTWNHFMAGADLRIDLIDPFDYTWTGIDDNAWRLVHATWDGSSQWTVYGNGTLL